MKYTERTDQLAVEIDAHQCELTDAAVDRMLAGLDTLERATATFPVSALHVLVEHNARSNDYSVKTSLELTGETLVASDTRPAVQAAFEQCVDALIENVKAYRERLGRVEDRRKAEEGTRRPLQPSADPDAGEVRAAVEAGDYTAFRAATFAYEEGVRKRAGRWVERYPDVNAQVGRALGLDDIVEEVFLTAFEEFPSWHPDVPLGEWLAHHIDPAVKALRAHPDEELENVRLARSARLAERGPDAV